jgi:ABC-type sugar transport system substrate-binding protein
MKKAIAILLVLATIFAVAACGGGGATTTPTPPPSGGDTNPPAGDGGSPATPAPPPNEEAAKGYNDLGFFDPDFDYSAYKTFKVALIASGNDFLTLEFDAAFKDWAKRMNINYTGLWAPAASNNDEYLSGVQLYCDQGYDGLIIQPDLNIYTRIVEILDEAQMPWASGIGQARTVNGTGALLHPSVGFDDFEVGHRLMGYCVDWKNKNFPDVPWEKVGAIAIDMGVSVEIMNRTEGEEQTWVATWPEAGEFNASREINPKNFWICDTAMGTFDQVTAQNMTTQVITANPQIEVWLIPAAVDFYAMGAAQAAEALGLSAKTIIVCNGGSQLPLQLDAGQETSWKSALFCPQTMFAEPMINMLWAFMAGLATPDSVYPEWIKWDDKGDNNGVTHTYAQLQLPAFWIDKDNYKSYLEWTDLYGYGPDDPGHYDYDKVTDLSLYSARAEVPASYAKP